MSLPHYVKPIRITVSPVGGIDANGYGFLMDGYSGNVQPGAKDEDLFFSRGRSSSGI
jgi:hypothetical protein